MSGRATLIHAAFRKSEEIDGEKGEKGEFAVNSFFIYPYDADVVLHPRQSLDLSLWGTTSPAPGGPSTG